MPADTTLGSVSIVITGDTTRLNADFSRAEGLAKAAGLKIATSLNAASAPTGQLSLALARTTDDLHGLAKAGEQLGFQFGAVNQGVTQFGAAASGAAAPLAAVAGATASVGTAAVGAGEKVQSFVGLIPGLGRAAEHFINLIPGLGRVIMGAFPVLGAVAFAQSLFWIGERVVSITSGFFGLSEAEKKAAEEAAALDKEIQNIKTSVEGIDLRKLTLLSGPDAGRVKEAADATAKANNDVVKVGEKTYSLSMLQWQLEEKRARLKERIALGETQGEAIVQSDKPGQSVEDFIAAQSRSSLPSTYGKFIAEYKKAKQELLVAQDEQFRLQREADLKSAEVLHGAHGLFEKQTDASSEVQVARNANAQDRATQEAAMARLVADSQVAAAHRVQVARIAAINDPDRAGMEAAREDVRVAQEKEASITAILVKELPKRLALVRAQGAAEKLKTGLGPDDLARIDESTRGKVSRLEADAAKEAFAAHENFIAAVGKLDEARITLIRKQAEDAASAWLAAYDVITNAADQTQKVLERSVEADLVNRTKVLEVQDQGEGETGALKVERGKLALAQKYALLIAPTAKQQTDYATQALQIEQHARDVRIAGLDKKRKDALTLDPNEDTNVKAKEIQEQINKLREEGANKDIEAQTRILVLLQRQRLEAQLKGAVENAIHQVPGALAGGLARGIIDGKAIGRDVREALKGVGEQLLGTVLKDLIVKIGAEIAAHTILGAIMVWLGGTQSTALALNTTAVTANTVAVHASTLKSAAGGIAGGVGGAAGGAGSAAGSAAGAAASGLVGPLIAAAGGIIGGVISGVMSLIGAHQIVRAINATTAAVYSLKGSSIGDSKSNALTGANATPGATATSGASQGGFTGFFASILGFGGSKPVDVNIVGISPVAPLKGLFHLFGFAEGGRPPRGVASIVGEKGAELWIPDEAGTIIPASAFNLPSTNVPQYMKAGLPAGGDSSMFASSNSSSIGDMTFHAHGMTNPEQFIDHVMRKLPDRLKARSPQFSPYSR